MLFLTQFPGQCHLNEIPGCHMSRVWSPMAVSAPHVPPGTTSHAWDCPLLHFPPHLCHPSTGSLPATPPAPFLPTTDTRGTPSGLVSPPSSAGSGSASACCVPVGPCNVRAWILPALPLHSGQTGFLASLHSTHLPRCAL